MKISKSKAENLLKDETFIELCDKMIQDQVNVFTGSALKDVDAREEAYRTVQLVNKMKLTLENIIFMEERKDKRK